ncbi:MAG: hypothetical protein K2X03_17215 [Bryobacteraceae bacterium]|nr:hypothetical protein [Bryobacteraceae bacterium]
MSAHLVFTVGGILVCAACTALMGRDSHSGHWRRFAYHAATGLVGVWTAAWSMYWLHG